MAETHIIESLTQQNRLKLEDPSIPWPQELQTVCPASFDKLQPGASFLYYAGESTVNPHVFLRGKVIEKVREDQPYNCIHLGNATHRLIVDLENQSNTTMNIAPDRVVDDKGTVHVLTFPVHFEPDTGSFLTRISAARKLGLKVYETDLARLYNSHIKLLPSP